MVTAKAPLAMTPADFLGPKSQAKNANAMPRMMIVSNPSPYILMGNVGPDLEKQTRATDVAFVLIDFLRTAILGLRVELHVSGVRKAEPTATDFQQ